MSSISLNSRWSSYMTLVSNIFIDEYMPQADGFYVKVYLYLLRSFSNPSKSVGICDIADILEVTERDVLRAISYWNKKGLISITKDESDNITSITFEDLLADKLDLNQNGTTNDIAKSVETHVQNPLSDTESKNTYNNVAVSEPLEKDNIHQILSDNNTYNSGVYDSNSIVVYEDLVSDDNFVEMKTIIETMLERPITAIEANLIVNLYSKYKFDADLIVHLFEYCIDNNKSESAMIEKIGMDWAINNITTIDAAKEYTLKYSDIYYNVIKAFGINNRSLGTNEKKFIVKWTSVFGYGADIIIEACNKTLSAIHQPSFEYADKILSVWYDNKVRNVKDIEVLKKKREIERKMLADKQPTAGKSATRAVKNTNSFNFEQRDYSDKEFEDFEKKALAKYINN